MHCTKIELVCFEIPCIFYDLETSNNLIRNEFIFLQKQTIISPLNQIFYKRSEQWTLGCFKGDTLSRKKLQCQYNPLQGIYKPYPEESFFRTSLEGRTTWPKMVKSIKIAHGQFGLATSIPAQIQLANILTKIDELRKAVFLRHT